MFDAELLDSDLRTALTLKADDLLFTVGGEAGRALQADFLGVTPFDGLASESFDETNAYEIELSRFAIATQVRELAAVVGERRWGPKGVPDTEDWRLYSLDFLGHFLSTLPDVQLGGFDASAVRNGALRDLYLGSSAWFDVVDAIAGAFDDMPDLFSIELSQVAFLSGRDLRTVRNHAGPAKQLRTTPERQMRRDQTLATPAFVQVHTFDAVDWLRRRGFPFPPLDATWAKRRMKTAQGGETIARSLLMLALVNFGSRDRIAALLAVDEDHIRSIESGGAPLESGGEQAIRTALGL